MQALHGKIKSGSVVRSGSLTSLSIDLYGDHESALKALDGTDVEVTLKKRRNRRSLAASRLCWELCTQIGRALTPPLPKEDVYRDAIRAVGEYDQYYIREEALEAFMETRKLLGVGWFAEVVGDAPLRGWVEVFAYKGSSTYDTKSMSTLIDYLVDQAEQIGLQIAYDLREIEQIKEDWARFFDKEE